MIITIMPREIMLKGIARVRDIRKYGLLKASGITKEDLTIRRYYDGPDV